MRSRPLAWTLLAAAAAVAAAAASDDEGCVRRSSVSRLTCLSIADHAATIIPTTHHRPPLLLRRQTQAPQPAAATAAAAGTVWGQIVPVGDAAALGKLVAPDAKLEARFVFLCVDGLIWLID